MGMTATTETQMTMSRRSCNIATLRLFSVHNPRIVITSIYKNVLAVQQLCAHGFPGQNHGVTGCRQYIDYECYNAIPGCTSALIPVSVLFLTSVLTGGSNSPRFLGLNSGSSSSTSNGGLD